MSNRIKITAGAVVLVLTMLLARPVLAAPQFSDLNGHWAANEVYQMLDLGVVNAYLDGSFRPDQSITRRELAQAVLVLFPALMEVNTNQVATYPDYPDLHNGAGQQYLNAAALLLPGYTDGYFKPDQPASRQDVVALGLSAALVQDGKYKLEKDMLLLQFAIADANAWRKLVAFNEFKWLQENYKKATAYWQDDPDKTNFYEYASFFYNHLNPVALLVGYNIITGYQDGALGLNKPVTRAETMVILSRIKNIDFINGDKYILESAGLVRLPQTAPAADPKIIEGNLDKLGQYYKEKYSDPLQRAQMLYNLVLHTFGYDWETRQGLKDYVYTDLPSLINTGLSTDAGLSAYYATLARKAGLIAAVIKGQGTNNGQSGEHTWVEIRLSQQVVEADPTYGVCTGAVFFNNFDQWRQQGYDWKRNGN